MNILLVPIAKVILLIIVVVGRGGHNRYFLSTDVTK